MVESSHGVGKRIATGLGSKSGPISVANATLASGRNSVRFQPQSNRDWTALIPIGFRDWVIVSIAIDAEEISHRSPRRRRGMHSHARIYLVGDQLLYTRMISCASYPVYPVRTHNAHRVCPIGIASARRNRSPTRPPSDSDWIAVEFRQNLIP